MTAHVWHRLPRPFLALAPMEDVTDTVFRRIVARCGRPDIFFTEFTSVDGLCSPGRQSVIRRLQYTEIEKPLIAQVWGKCPENYETAAHDLVELGFDGIDINMGCPVPKIVKNGCCSALIDNPVLAAEVIAATKQGAGTLPVSVKTRLGTRVRKTEEWTQFLLEQGIAALTMHGRTAREMSKVPACWEEIGKVVEIRDSLKSETVILGNGDVESIDQARSMAARYGVDGVMIGRGIFKNLFIFDREEQRSMESLSPGQRLGMLMEHAESYFKTWGEEADFRVLKKFFKIYVSGFPGAVQLRTDLIESDSFAEVKERISGFNLECRI